MKRTRKDSGLAALPLVVMVAMIMFLSLLALFQTTRQQQEVQADVELRTDFYQRQQAFGRAVLAVVPNKMMACMRVDSANQATQFTWDQIFTEAIAMAQAQQVDQSAK